MSNKDKCKEIMGQLFGPATANLVDSMSDNEVVEKCKSKVTAMLGSDKAKLFDAL